MNTYYWCQTCFTSTLYTLTIKFNCSLKSTTKGNDNFQRKEEKVLELSLAVARICLSSGKHLIIGKSFLPTQNKRKLEMLDKI